MSIDIYNILGQKVRTLVEKTENPGPKIVIWDGKNNLGQPVGSGTYFYRIKAKDQEQTFTQIKKMVLVK